ncbi:hypothetical protein HNP40_003813 [Mycobacteroides chelonae]|nr:hypothetical protein [Mycobacteroides chelonae]
MRRTTKLLLAVLAAMVVSGGVVWFVQSRQVSAKGDCDIAADMMAYRKKTGDEISSVKDKLDDMDDPNGFILKKYDDWQNEVPKYVAKIKDSDIKARAQAVVDSDTPMIKFHRERLLRNEPSFPNDAEIDATTKKLQGITDRMSKATDDLRQRCPNIPGASDPRL